MVDYLLRSVNRPFWLVSVHVRSEGRELPGMGASAIFICLRVCHGVRGAYSGIVPGGVRVWLCGQSSNSIVNMEYKKTVLHSVCSHDSRYFMLNILCVLISILNRISSIIYYFNHNISIWGLS